MWIDLPKSRNLQVKFWGKCVGVPKIEKAYMVGENQVSRVATLVSMTSWLYTIVNCKILKRKLPLEEVGPLLKSRFARYFKVNWTRIPQKPQKHLSKPRPTRENKKTYLHLLFLMFEPCFSLQLWPNDFSRNLQISASQERSLICMCITHRDTVAYGRFTSRAYAAPWSNLVMSILMIINIFYSRLLLKGPFNTRNKMMATLIMKWIFLNISKGKM